MIRKPMFAGQFYPDDKGELIDEARRLLSAGRKENVQACIVPHAGWTYSGKLAGRVISKIPEKKTFIILGVNHSGIGSRISLSLDDFSTPIGIVKNNNTLSEQILAKLKILGYADVNAMAHEREHSIEVILPFLQLSQRNFDIVPILFKDMSDVACIQTAYILSKFVSKDVCVIVSSDFTHLGASYGFTPFSFNKKENLYKLDGSIINSILSLDSKSVYEKAKKSTVCGIYGITTVAEIGKLIKLKPELVDYYTSGEVTGDYENCVGYAGIVFT